SPGGAPARGPPARPAPFFAGPAGAPPPPPRPPGGRAPPPPPRPPPPPDPPPPPPPAGVSRARGGPAPPPAGARAGRVAPRAIRAARAARPELPLVVEVETLDELREALAEGCDRVLIDDFDPGMRREAVAIARGAPFAGRIPLEVSGGVEFDGLPAIADDGVDFVSIGGLTKHVRAIDMSLKLG